MPRTKLLVSALALALGGASVAQAQSFSGVITFGDSLSDSGNVALVDGNPFTPPGSSFTTNPDSVYAEIVAEAFGFSGASSLSGGSNYAYGGACARANTGGVGGFTCVNSPGSFSLTTQLGGYLAANGGSADPNALYMMWGGANDIFTAGGNPATAQLNTGIAAQTMVGLIGTLQNAGARTIVVFNLPDLGLTPLNVGTASQAGASGLAFVYNSTFNAGLATLGDGIVPINTYQLINEIVASPSLYGFTNVTGTACGTASGSLACGPAGNPNYFYHYPTGTNSSYLFADGVHPTGAAHAMLANVVLSTLSAPGEVSMAGEIPLQVYDDQSRTINRQIFGAGGRDVGSTSVYGAVNIDRQEFEASANTSAMDNDLFTLTFGADFRSSESFSFGAAATFGSSDGDVGGSSIENKEVLLSGYAVGHFGIGYVSGSITGGSANLDIVRHIVLGPNVRSEVGNTSATHTGAELGAGLTFGDDSFRHGPFISATWQKIDVQGYAEDGLDATAMYFSDFNNKSTVGRIGYQAQGDMDGFRPFGRVAWARDTQDRVTRVQAGSNTMNGHFTLDGFPGAEDWIEAELGMEYAVSDSTNVSLSYRARLSDDTQDLKAFNLGFRKEFGAAAAPAPEPVVEEVVQATCADLDDDSDGVNNCNDKCPTSAAGEAVGADGCPMPAAEPEPVMEAKPFRN
jgi:outer membrane lipase/esterase